MRFLITLLAIVSSSAEADAVTREVSPSLFTGDYLLQVVGSFFLVICALLAVMVLLKRFNAVGVSKGGYIQVLASTPLGQRERAVLLQVGADQILVAVAAGNVTTLHKFSDPIVPLEKDASLSFKDVWNFARDKQGERVAMLARIAVVLVLFLASSAADAQTIPLVTSSTTPNGNTEYALGIQILMVMTVLTLLPAMLITMTAFTRILIVLAILRQALGTQPDPIKSNHSWFIVVFNTLHHVTCY